MLSLYESILSGRKSLVDNNIAAASLDILHDHSRGIGNSLIFIDDTEDAVVSNNGILEFRSGLTVNNGADVRKEIHNSGVKAPYIRISSYNEYDVEKCLGDLICQNLYIEGFKHIKNINVRFTTFGTSYCIPNNWRPGVRKPLGRVGYVSFYLGRTSSDRGTILENVNLDNSAGSCTSIIFNDGNPVFKNFNAPGYNSIRIYDLSCWDERFSSVAKCITQLFDKTFQFSHMDRGVEVTRNCNQLKKISAFFNNPKRYTITEPAYKLTDTKVSDLWDLSGMPDVNEICIEDNNVSLYLFKEKQKALTYLPIYYMMKGTHVMSKEEMLEHYKTADGWYVVFRKRYN